MARNIVLDILSVPTEEKVSIPGIHNYLQNQ
jgi:hypothetical protein